MGILDELIDYTKIHFAAEEKYFKEYNYPDTEEYIRIHNGFVAKAKDLHRGLSEGRVVLSNWNTSSVTNMGEMFRSAVESNNEVPPRIDNVLNVH